MLRKLSVINFILLISFGSTLFAQNKIYTTKKINPHPPQIDGIIDDGAWAKVKWENNFTQYQPNEGEAPSQKTSFKILYDDDNIYVAIKAFDTEPDKIERRMTRRDGWEGDKIGIHLDTYFDKRTAFVFVVNAAGVKNDGIMIGDGDDFDDSWDPIWDAKTSIDSEGWNAEMKIPLSQLRFGNKKSQVWGMQVIRDFFRDSEFSIWKFIPQENPGWVSEYGELHGIENIKPKKQIEIAPYLMTSYSNYEKEEGNPFATGSDYTLNAGLDGKIGITNDLILDFTINPDFGQVEADPSEVNLSAFESYFEEKRPFFIEGKNITNFAITPGGSPWSQDNLFYSRRVGRRPHNNPDLSDGEYADVPENTKILGAVKLTGKTQDGWSIGIIESITSREYAEIDFDGGERKKELVEPLSNYFIGRVQKDINKGNTIIGAMFTTSHRKLEEGKFDYLTNNAITGGIDFKQYFKDKKYFIDAKFIASKINGSKEAILEQQLSSRRYFQRPDADYIKVDSNLTSLSGTGGNFSFGKQSNSGFRFAFNVTWRTPGIELNDVGYLRQANSIFQYTWISYRTSKPISIFRTININMNQWSGFDFGGLNLFNGGNINTWVQFTNLWSVSSGYNIEFDGISNTELRGGSSMKEPGGKNLFLSIRSNRTKKLYSSVGLSLNNGNHNSANSKRYWVDITYRPVNNLSVSLEPMYSKRFSELQYVTESEYNDNARYVMGRLDQKTFSLTIRIDYNITPDLTIQFYGSPFVSAGAYSEFKKIIDPHADEYANRFMNYASSEISYDTDGNGTYMIDESGNGDTDYSFDNPDFNFKQFRANMVLRWEYIPGSAIYAVWSQGRTGYDISGAFDYLQDMDALFSVKAHNVFLIKLSHRFRAEKWL
ncbi:MAG: hypothetical protein B6I20_10285 [Bacteroidetes bacterium 4572_117]|nr:MAG: hypothetical protein B6I20_10285 [Bacteroidetes bacterium 4572_117]